MKKFMEEEIGIKPTVKTARRLGKRTCMVELGSEDEKLVVMQNKSKLRNRPGNKVFIEDDLTREERIIRQRAKEEKNKGKQVKIGLLKLVVDGQIWKWNSRETILQKVDSDSNSSKN
ncbi:hypothetical protein QE152_g40755 [Popillia japonica]|uniref:Uncharacterized protein n=1 Tax=Popillia japonica TaxID=7064 RepID=A0AAW1HFL5_POPJA